MTRTIEIGTLVTDSAGGEYIYGGEYEHGDNGSRISIDLRNGGRSTIHTAAWYVAPVEAITPDPKDPRITARKVPREEREAIGQSKYGGPWYAFPEGLTYADDITPLAIEGQTKTKAVEKAARRLAIADWHEQ